MDQAVKNQIEQYINNDKVVLFMKGEPEFPQCGFSGRAVEILERLGCQYKGVNVLEDNDIREGIKEFADWPTIPQLYVNGEFVGGSDLMMEMYQSGELEDALK